MLDQELVFRRQVFELHELYRIQTAMMEDLKQKGSNNYNLHKGRPTPVPINLNNQFKCSMAEYMQFENFNLDCELQQQPPVSMRKPLELQLSADEFIGQCVYNSSGKGVICKNSSQNKVVFDPDHLNLSLSIGQDASKKGRELGSWKGKKTCSSSIDIIDLEDANSSFSNFEAYLGLTSGSAAPKSCSRDKHKLDSFLKSGKHKLESFSQSAIRDGSYGITLHRSPVDAGPSCQTQSLCDSGSNGHHKKFLPANLLNKNQRSPSCKIINSLDLNTVQLEDQSYFSNNHSVVVNSSITSSSPVLEKVYPKSNIASSVSPKSWRGANVSSFKVMHGIHRQKDVNFEDDGEKCSKDGKFREGNEANVSIVDLDSDSSEELCSSGSDPKISSVGSSSKVSNGLSCEMDMVDAVGEEANLEKGVEPFEQLNYCKLSRSSESEGVTDHHSSSIKTMQSGVQCDDINFTTSDEGEKINTGRLVTQSGEQDLRSSDSSESNIQCIISEEPEVDGTVQIAAELLVQLSSETGAFCLDVSAKMPLKMFQNEEDDQPQCSSESYEAMVLKAEESTPDDYSVSSNAYLVDVSEKKDIRYKLKRGTRMKDFQKDIFPGLSTLSRQEIREDINILEGVIRSREYKKMRATIGDGGSDWCRSTRSKRSKVGRRYYS